MKTKRFNWTSYKWGRLITSEINHLIDNCGYSLCGRSLHSKLIATYQYPKERKCKICDKKIRNKM